MASLFKRSNGIYNIAYEDDGRRKWKSTGTRCSAPRKLDRLLGCRSDDRRLLLSFLIRGLPDSLISRFPVCKSRLSFPRAVKSIEWRKPQTW